MRYWTIATIVALAVVLFGLAFAGCSNTENPKATPSRGDGVPKLADGAPMPDEADLSLSPAENLLDSLEITDSKEIDPLTVTVPLKITPSEPKGLESPLPEMVAPADSLKRRGGQVSGDAQRASLRRVGGNVVSGRSSKKKPAPGPAVQVTTWKRSQIVPNTSRLTIGDREELPLQGMQADVRIDGFRARVLLDCYYFNDSNRQLEGTFQLRLPNGASPFYFAFGETRFRTRSPKPQEPQFFTSTNVRRAGSSPNQILAFRSESWPAPKEARIVPKEKAAFSYRQTVVRLVDPALVEWSGAGVFRSRVYPLMPKKLHRIVIGYDVDLLDVGEDLTYRLDLPKTTSRCVVDLSIAAVEGAKLKVSPQVESVNIAGRTYYRFENPVERTITVRLEKPGALLLRGVDAEAEPFFATRFRPDLPSEATNASSPQGIFLVDVSLSSNPERFNVWLKLLRAILDENRGSLKEFSVLFFNIESFWWQDKFMANTPKNVEALMAFADTLVLEGATDLGRALAESASPAWQVNDASQSWDLFLLSDSAATWGENDPYALSKILKSGDAGALFAYTTGFSGSDSRLANHLARESGGAVFTMVGEAEVAKAAKAHRSRPWRLTGVQIDGGGDLLLAGRPQTVFPGQNLLLVGRGSPDVEAQIVLTLRQGETIKIVKTRLAAALESELAPRSYGQVAVNQLEDLQSLTEEFSTAYARQFRVTGRTCSLLMLESEADYKRFNIKPEEDALVVKLKPAAELIGDALQKLDATLGDPKATFLAWLKKLEKMPGMKFQTSTAFRLALEKMPRSSFEVAAPPLACKARRFDDVPGAVQEQLASKKLTYDVIAAEAQRRLAKWGPHDALRAISSLVEIRPGDVVLARDVGYSAMEWRLGAQAYHLFRRVANSRPFEPQTYHALARCLEEMNKPDLALAYYEVALKGGWGARFGEFQKIASWDYLRFLRRISDGELKTSVPNFALARLKSTLDRHPLKMCDLVVIIAWNTDRTDVDLHVTDPTGEECYYRRPDTKIGGRITEDVTGGYGPEMFTLPKAVPGEYLIRVKYFSTDANRATTRTKVYATIYQGWGTNHEKITRKVVALSKGKAMHTIARLKIE